MSHQICVKEQKKCPKNNREPFDHLIIIVCLVWVLEMTVNSGPDRATVVEHYFNHGMFVLTSEFLVLALSHQLQKQN